jgi:cytochrome c-type biogenesis protein CcmH
MQEVTARLEARLQHDGGSAADWELLAKSYEFLGQPAAAARARQNTATRGTAQQTGVAENRTEGGSGMPSASVVAKLTSLADSAPQSRTDPSGAATTAATISGTVSIEARLASRVDRNAVLFVYAKAADAPGPPLAVLRLSANSWPVSFQLDDSMAMLPSRRLSQFPKVIVEARISRSGQAAPATGDLYVTSNAVSPSSGKKLALVINHEIG